MEGVLLDKLGYDGASDIQRVFFSANKSTDASQINQALGHRASKIAQEKKWHIFRKQFEI